MTTLFTEENEDLYVAFLDKLFLHDGAWLWSPQFIIKIAWTQGGYVPYDHRRWERQMIKKGRLSMAVGNPRTYHPIMVSRGGMPRQDDDNPVTYLQDPKKAMNYFAQQKIQMHAPTILGPTTSMLLKAEARTVSALMNSKSAAQTQQNRSENSGRNLV